MPTSPNSGLILAPPIFDFLLGTGRYKVAYGGRGSAKSWSVARVLVALGALQPLNILCAREYQVSIADSVHRLLATQIDALGLSAEYDVTQREIVSRCGTSFIFRGLHVNPRSIKSLEAIDICWVEEAETVSNESWEVLVPTIRRPSSEIWVTFNPRLEDDPAYRRFVSKPPPNAVVRKVSWRDNPFFPAELAAERDYLQRIDPEAHAHIWEGECQVHGDAQVFRGKWTIESFEPRPDWSGPYFGADWGFSQDPTALVKVWVHENTLYVEHEAYAVGCDIDKTPALFSAVPDATRETVRADNARPETISYMRQHGYPRMEACSKWKGCVEDGIAHIRSYERIVIHRRCTHTAQEMRLYSYKVDKLSGNVMSDVEDKHNHCIDALRYAVEPLITRARSFFG